MPKRKYTRNSEKDRMIGLLLAAQRKKAKRSQEELARLIGRPQSFISNVEVGQHRVDIVELMGFAEALKFDPASFIKRVRESFKTRA